MQNNELDSLTFSGQVIHINQEPKDGVKTTKHKEFHQLHKCFFHTLLVCQAKDIRHLDFKRERDFQMIKL